MCHLSERRNGERGRLKLRQEISRVIRVEVQDVQQQCRSADCSSCTLHLRCLLDFLLLRFLRCRPVSISSDFLELLLGIPELCNLSRPKQYSYALMYITGPP